MAIVRAARQPVGSPGTGGLRGCRPFWKLSKRWGMSMPKAEWGAKHLCSCGAKFYDMGNLAATCPKCGIVPDDGRREAKHAIEAAETEKSHPVADNEADDGIEDGFTDEDDDDGADDNAYAVASG